MSGSEMQIPPPKNAPNRTLIRISIWIFRVPKVTERPGPARDLHVGVTPGATLITAAGAAAATTRVYVSIQKIDMNLRRLAYFALAWRCQPY